MRVKIQFITLASALKTGCIFNIIVALFLSLPYAFCTLTRLFVPPSMLDRSLFPLQSALVQLGCVTWFIGFCAYILLSTFGWGLITVIYNAAALFTGGLTLKLTRRRQPEPVPTEEATVSKYDDEPEPIHDAQTLTGVGREVDQRQPAAKQKREEHERLERVRGRWRGST